MRDWLLARRRGAGGGGSSRRAMLSRAAHHEEGQQGDEEKGNGPPKFEILRRYGPEEEGKEPSPTNGLTPAMGSAATTPSPRPARSLPSPLPARLRRSSSDRRSHSLGESVHSVLTSLHHVKLHKTTYRLLVAAVVLLAAFLALLLIVSLIYGFGLQFPQISVVDTEPLAPSLVDAHGNIPLRSYLEFQNPNIFRIYAKPSEVAIYTDPERTHLLGRAQVPAVALHAHERHRRVETEYAIEGIMQVQGGPALVTKVAQGKPTLFYTTSVIGLRVKGLGFVPVLRHYEVKCRVLKLWGKPKGNATAAGQPGEEDENADVSVADCHGRFV